MWICLLVPCIWNIPWSSLDQKALLLLSLFFLLSSRILMLSHCSSTMKKDHFLLISYGTKWPLCVNVPVNTYSFIPKWLLSDSVTAHPPLWRDWCALPQGRAPLEVVQQMPLTSLKSVNLLEAAWGTNSLARALVSCCSSVPSAGPQTDPEGHTGWLRP